MLSKGLVNATNSDSIVKMELYFLGGLVISDKTREKYVVRTTTLPSSDR